MVELDNTPSFVFTNDAVLRAVAKLEEYPIHEHFAGYLAILRAQQIKQGSPIRLADVVEFHDRYLRVIGAPEKAPYVRPFKSRGRGLELFNANVAGSYAPSSLRARGALKDIIEVKGESRSATYGLKADHAVAARKNLLKDRKVPITALTVFLYRDYGFQIGEASIAKAVTLFRQEFGIADVEDQRHVFEVLFADDLDTFKVSDLEALQSESHQNG